MTEVALLEEERQKRSGTPIQTLTSTMPSERANRPEVVRLDLAAAHHLLREHGYDLVERYGHVHATRDEWEWHLCLVIDLASMPPARLLACLAEAHTLRVEQSIALSPLTDEEGANMRSDRREPFRRQEVS